jgi:hypothetical protein
MARTIANRVSAERLKDLARRGAELALKELRAEIVAIERTFRNLASPRDAVRHADL